MGNAACREKKGPTPHRAGRSLLRDAGVLRSLLHDADAVNAFDGRELGDKLVGCGGVEVEHGVGGVAAGLVRELSMFAPTSPNTPVIWLSMSGTLACSTATRPPCAGAGPMSQAG